MSTQRVQFTEWLPDQPDNSGGLNDALNVIPVTAGYQPFPNAVDFSGEASEALNAVFVAKWGTDVDLFAGGATKLFKFNSDTEALDDVSGTAYTGSVNTWKFTQFGKTVLAVNGAQPIQYWTIGLSTVWADISTSPIAKQIAVVRDFVVVGNVAAGSLGTSTVQWSDINDETDWTAGATSQSDLQVVADGGNLVAVTGGEFGLIFLEKSIQRMSYIGSPLFFQFDNISRGLGCLSGNSVCQYNNTTFFLSDDGFYSCDGASVTPLGNEKIDRWFFDDINLALINSMSSSINPTSNIAIWNYANNSGGRTILIYNWSLGKWSRVNTLSTVLGNIATVGVTLEGLTDTSTIAASSIVSGKSYTIASLDDGSGGATTDFTTIGASANTVGLTFSATGTGTGTGTAIDTAAMEASRTTLETLPASLDARLWVGGKFLFAGATDAKISTFTGSDYNSQLITTDIEVGYNSVVNLIRPQVDSGSANIAIASRKELDDAIIFSPTVTTTSEGRANVRSGGRYHRVACYPTGNWTTAMAVDVDIKPQGNR